MSGVGEESLGKRGYKHKYKQYLRDPTLPVPKTTTWRYNKKTTTALNNNASTSSTSSAEINDCHGHHRKRRLYNKSGQIKIPRQTAWSWKRHGGEKFNSIGLFQIII